MNDDKNNRLEDEYNQLLERVRRDDSSFVDFYRARGAIRTYLESNPHPDQTTKINLAVIGSHTLDPLTVCLDVAARIDDLDPEIFQGGFNLYHQEILNPDSALYQFQPAVTILSLDSRNCLGDSFFHSSPDYGAENVKRMEGFFEELVRLIEFYLKQSPTSTLLVGNLPVPLPSPNGILAEKVSGDPKILIRELNRKLRENFRKNPRVFIVDIDESLAEFGKRKAIDPRLEYIAGIPFAHDSFPYLARKYSFYLRALSGLTRKVLVLDLDNTLWGGIVGEEGLEGIELGDTPVGRAFVDFQKNILDLHHRGVILAVNSKNNYTDAIKVLHDHPEMILREDVFTSLKINWKDKVTNMQEIAGELNLGLDSFVFLDDNPVEREFVKESLPRVTVPELPGDPLNYPAFIRGIRLFEQASLTREDRNRAQLYRQRGKAEVFKTNCDSLEDYLKGLEMKARISRTDSYALPRIAQMFQKTNQFNLTTKRYPAAELEKFKDSPLHQLWNLELSDRFGNNGIVAAALIEIDQKDKTATIDSLLMSCRVIGRFVEDYFLSFICDTCREDGINKLVGLYSPTERNAPVKDLYPRLKFTPTGESDGLYFFELDISSGGLNPPEWVGEKVLSA